MLQVPARLRLSELLSRPMMTRASSRSLNSAHLHVERVWLWCGCSVADVAWTAWCSLQRWSGVLLGLEALVSHCREVF